MPLIVQLIMLFAIAALLLGLPVLDNSEASRSSNTDTSAFFYGYTRTHLGRVTSSCVR